MPRIPTLVNLVPRLVLSGPGHRLMSRRYLLLDFTGRRSGRRYVLPVAYVADGATLQISTDSRWRVNVDRGQPFHVVLGGTRRSARARRVAGPAAVSALRSLVQIRGYAAAAGLHAVDGVVSEAELHRGARERAVLAIDLEAGS